MFVITETWTVRLFDVFSLKDKRSHREKIIKGKLKASYIAVAEIEHHDNQTVLVIGIAVVAQSQKELEQRYQHAYDSVASEYDFTKEEYV